MMKTVLFIIGIFAAPVIAAPDITYAKKEQGTPVSVHAEQLQKLAVFVKHKAPAVVAALNNSEISAEVNAKIVEIPVQVGQVIEPGALIAKLDCRDYKLSVSREKTVLKSLDAKIEFAQYQLQRAQKLSKQQAVPEELLKQRETDLRVLEADLEGIKVALKQAQYNVARCTIRSPFKALVVERLGQVGELASPGTSILRLLDIQNNEISAKLQSHQVNSLENANTPVFVTRQNEYPLKLRVVSPSVETRERTQEVRLSFMNKTALPGESGELRWNIKSPHIPADLLVKRQGQLGVFVVTDNKAKFVAIKDAVEGRPSPTTMPASQLIVTKGRFRLHDGATVVLN